MKPAVLPVMRQLATAAKAREREVPALSPSFTLNPCLAVFRITQAPAIRKLHACTCGAPLLLKPQHNSLKSAQASFLAGNRAALPPCRGMPRSCSPALPPGVSMALLCTGEAAQAAAAAAERRWQGVQPGEGGFTVSTLAPDQPPEDGGGSGAVTASPHDSTPDLTPDLSPVVSPRQSFGNVSEMDDLPSRAASTDLGQIPGMSQYLDAEVSPRK